MSAAGKFYGVGVGPGDPELITLKAARILAEVDWIFLPATASNAPGLAHGIVAPTHLDPAKFRPVTLCMSRERGADLDAYARAAADILAELRQGKDVAWIAEGDPLFYSTFSHVWAALRELDPHLDAEIVPGITSIQAAAARAGIPIAALEERVAILPAAYGLHRLPTLLAEFATVFLLKVNAVFDELVDSLTAMSPPVQAVYVEKVGAPEERIVRDLASLRGHKLPYFSLVILSHKLPARETHAIPSTGRVFVVGIGPGDRGLLTPQAEEAIRAADIVVGYSGYFPWIEELLHGKERLAFPLGQEKERAQAAFAQAAQGRSVAVISSGDPGVYAMASMIVEWLDSVDQSARPEVVVVPGISALNAAAALLGAPLGHDFAAISLSDLLTPWEVIEKRVAAAAVADFVLAIFNPKSQRRDWQLPRAREILLAHRAPSTPVGIVHNAFRHQQRITQTTLGDLNGADVDMFSIVFIGNQSSRFVGNFLLTPRGYFSKEEKEAVAPSPRAPRSSILDESFRIIEREVGAHSLDSRHWPIVRRMIHASGDLDLLTAVRFHNDPVSAALEAISRSTPIVTDVTMVLAGIHQPSAAALGIPLHCFLNAPGVAQVAEKSGITRSAAGMEQAIAEVKDGIYVIGNAPTALLELCSAVRAGRVRPALIIAMPVGFVAVAESKDEALRLDVPVITVLGRKGGSAIAAATVNALLQLAQGDER